MATIPRSGPLPAPTNVTSGRGGPPTRVSSVGGSSVDQILDGSGVSFESATFGFQEEGQVSYDQGSGKRGGQGFPGFVDAPTKIFAAMLETTDISQGNDDRSEGSAPGTVPYVGIAAKAIQIYETNARIAGGEPRYLGTSVSVVL